jgi:SNF2 family DNA or RNA helicase
MKSNLKNCKVERHGLLGLTWDRMISDEAHSIKNEETKVFVAALHSK